MNENSLVSVADLDKEQILSLLEAARFFEENPNHKVLDGKVAATLFFEPSTRTRLSFETAVNRLGGRVIGFSDASTSSSSKGETLKDTIKMVSNYVDIIIMRHFLEGAARYATEVTDVPVVNAGDGATSILRRRCSTSIPSSRPRALLKTSPSLWWVISNTAAQCTPC